MADTTTDHTEYEKLDISLSKGCRALRQEPPKTQLMLEREGAHRASLFLQNQKECTMRDALPKKELITDPATGSTLVFNGFMGGRGGGETFRFDYREAHSKEPIAFGLHVTTFTNFMLDRHRAKQGLPKINGIAELQKYSPEFMEKYGDFNRVEEWYLIGPDGRWIQGPPEAQRTWSGFSLEEGRRIIDTFFRLYFELTARRPGVTSDNASDCFYPDTLEFKPYDLPPLLIETRRAAPGKDI